MLASMQHRPDHWARVKQVLDLALQVAPADRPRVVREACAGSSDLERDVESLLEYSDQTGRLDDCLEETVRNLTWSTPAPRQAGPYRIDRRLGTGGMATVYLAVREDDELPARVALKVIQDWSSEGLLERFRGERRILAGLIHPYIARLLDAGKLDDGRPYFVMEYVDGQTIDEYAAKLDQAAILELFLKVCSAVQFAHQNLVIHRDIKPGNILVTATGEPRLLDFGIAKLLTGDGAANVTQPFERMLTPVGASPEQTRGEAVTVASDVYSLGVLLYRLVTGVSPYAGAPDLTADPIRVIREYAPPRASAAAGLTRRDRTRLEGDLDTILQKAMEKEPGRRYPTVHALSADLERHLRGLPIEARPASSSYRAVKFIRRNLAAVSAATLVFLTIAAGMIGISIYARQAHLEQQRSERELGALRQLTQSFLFEFDDAIKNLPGSSEARALVVRRTVEYLDKVAAEAGDDSVLLNDLADAYTHVAEIAGASRSARGDSSPRSSTENALKALAIRRRLAALNPHNEGMRRKLEDCIWIAAGRYTAAGDIEHARVLDQEHMRMCQAALKRADSVEERYALGTSYTSNGSIERELGHYDAALEYQRRGLAVREGLLQADPSSKRAQRVVGISHEFIGYALSSLGSHAAAAEEHRQALGLFEPIAKSDPANINMQRLVGVAQVYLCESLALAGSPNRAVSHCEAAVAINRAAAEADPKNVQASEDLADSESVLSTALDFAHAPQAALAHQQKARELFDAAMSRDPGQADLQETNAKSLIELARLRSQLHVAGAATAAEQAVRTLEAMAARSPQSRVIGTLLEQAQGLRQSIQ
jgi:non-specific serine/threonine protein kinase/serine/threonine-protein kinase